MDILTGTSGFAYKEWKGAFYPDDLPADRFLRYYGERFRACEINNTFYRMPNPRDAAGLVRGGPAGVPLRAQVAAPDHALEATEGLRSAARVPGEECARAR